MARQIKEAKNIEIFVNITYKVEDEKLIQIFTFTVSNKKYLSYLFDARLLFKSKIEKILNDFLLEGFVSRIDGKDFIEMKYNLQKIPKPCIRKIQVYLPPFFGCKYCRLAENNNGTIYCREKNKHYTEGIKRCQIFKSKDKIIS